jgi:hypothetical protein
VEHVSYAVELIALVIYYPSKQTKAKGLASQMLIAIETEFPQEMLASAVERGKARDLNATVCELLVSLN